MKKFVILFAILATLALARQGEKGSISECERPRGQCRARKMAFMKCIPRKCLMVMGRCIGQKMQPCHEASHACMQNVDMNKCDGNRHACEQKNGGEKCDSAMNKCMGGIKVGHCYKAHDECFKKAQAAGGKDCNKGMHTCMTSIPGYNACQNSANACYQAQAKLGANADFNKCNSAIQGCMQKLDTGKLAGCNEGMQKCMQGSPTQKCADELNNCQNQAGQSKCHHEFDQCRRGMPQDKCNSEWEACANAQGKNKCDEENHLCQERVSNDAGECMNKAQACAKGHAGADKCLLAMQQMRSLGGKPSGQIKHCFAEAGVKNGDSEHTGNACKLAQCITPHFAAPQVQCWLNCKFQTTCGCKGLTDPAGFKCAAIGKPQKGGHGRGGHHLSSFEEEDMTHEDAFHMYFDL